jgi:hypothetical protein
MPYKSKTTDEYVIQQNYGYGLGYEDVYATDSRPDAKQALKDYRDNLPQYPARLITRRIPKGA